MTDTQLPKALQLAAMFDYPLPPDWGKRQAAAAELRRLNAREDELLHHVCVLQGMNDESLESIRALTAELEQARATLAAQGEPVAWPLRAQVWKRESTQEWVLEIAGTLGDTDMNIRHTQPLSVAYENVPGLPTFYAPPAPAKPMTDGEIDYLKQGPSQSHRDFARAIEAHHGITAKGGA